MQYIWKDRKRYFGLPLSFTRYRLSDDRLFISEGFLNIKDDEILDRVTMSEDTKKKVREECGITLPHFQVIMGKLRKSNVIVDNKINPKFIPNIDEESGNFKLLLLFDLK